MRRQEAIANLRKLLMLRREALYKAIDGDDSLLQELSNPSEGDMADFALDTAHHEISSQLASNHSRELRKIDEALAAMAKGTYGLCEYCNQPIAMPRLEALPYATMCIEHAREAELYGHDGVSPARWDRIPDLETDVDVTINDLESFQP